MSPTRTQPLLRGSRLSPLSRQATPKDSRLSASGPYLLPPAVEAPHEAGTKVLSLSNLIPDSGYLSLQQSSHVQGATYASMAPESHPGIFGPNSKNMFNGGNHTFQHNTHVHQAHNMRSAIQILCEHSSPGAAYNSKDRYDAPKCHPNTRTGLLNTTRNWAQNGPSRILWLHGSAGAGKSAVAQTLAMELRAASNLAASFFFSRTAQGNSNRGHEGCFVTTMAYQLTEAVLGLRVYVEYVISTRPSVFHLTLTEQVVALIIEPLKELQLGMARHASTACMLPRVIVIDGLDECKEEGGQIQVLEALTTLVSHQDIFPCSVFVASRPEVVIRSWVTNKQSEDPQLLRSISLLDHCDSDHDIKVFMNDETSKIKQSHPLKYLIPAGWPSPGLVEQIVKRASGQFVYASTIIKYIKDIRGHPSERLEAILKYALPSDDRPYADLDALYLHILRQTKHPKLVCKILAFLVTTTTFWVKMSGNDSRPYLRILLSSPHSVHALLVDLPSIINCDEDGMSLTGNESRARADILYPAVFHHASLLEFLLDPHRSEDFYVDIPTVDKELYETSLQHLEGESYLAVADEQYILYCFLILLQTRTSCQPSCKDQVIKQLTRWDPLHNQMLYMILCRLHNKSSTNRPDDMVNIIHRDLWPVFAPAVARIPAQCRQDFESAQLPLELRVMYHPNLFPAVYRNYTGFIPSLAPCKLLEWHVKACIQRDTGVNTWRICSLKKYQFWLNNYRESEWHDFMHVLDKYLPATQKNALIFENLQRDARVEWQILAPSAASFIIRHLNTMLDALEESSQFIVENQEAYDHLKRTGGKNWRALTAGILLHKISGFLWGNCPLSAEVISALEETSQKLFPLHVVSTMEGTTFPFDFPHSESRFQKYLWHSFSSQPRGPCTLPRCFSVPPHFGLTVGPLRSGPLHNLGQLHDYIHLYLIRNGPEPPRSDGFESGCIHDCDTEPSGNWNQFSDKLAACEVAKKTIDPITGLPIDMDKWSMWSTWKHLDLDISWSLSYAKGR